MRDWAAYHGAAVRGESPVAGQETVEGSARVLEQIWLGLRTDQGLPWPLPGGDAAQRLAQRWTGSKQARIDGDRLVLTPEGWLVLDRLAVDLAARLDG